MKPDLDEVAWTLYRQFVDRFGAHAAAGADADAPADADGGAVTRPQRVTPGEIRDAETALDAHFPASITQFWLKQGCGTLPGIAAAAAVFPRPADAPPPIRRFLAPSDIVRETRSPRYAPIPGWVCYEEDHRDDIARDDAWQYLLPIAADTSPRAGRGAVDGGRWICLLRYDNIEVDLPVYHFDPDAGRIDHLADGFDDLLRAYLRLPGPKS